MSVPDSVQSLIYKVHKLAQQGIDGEAEAAQRKLDLLLAKYGVTLDDIIRDEVKTYKLTCRNDRDERLMVQVYYAVIKKRHGGICGYVRGGRKIARKIGLDMTAEQYVDFQEQLTHYRAAWKTEEERLFTAFCHKHELLRPADDEDREYSREEIEEYLKMKKMMGGLNEKTFFRPAALIAQ